MLKFMLDTDIAIYTIKRRPVGVKRMFNIHTGSMCISAVTLGELVYGCENSSNPKQNLDILEGFVGRLEMLQFDEKAARHFGQLRLELKAKLLGPYDLMIAAHARSEGLVLVTNNVREFKRVPGLRVENWAK